MARDQDSARRSHAPICSVCDGRRAQAPVVLCADCAHPDRVRTYCAHCEVRLDLSLEGARELFGKFGLKITHPGVALLFPDGCPDCRGGLPGTRGLHPGRSRAPSRPCRLNASRLFYFDHIHNLRYNLSVCF